MKLIEVVEGLNGAPVIAGSGDSWAPHGILGVENLRSFPEEIAFDLLVPTYQNDVGDYIWRSEREAGTTDKVQLFQNDGRVSQSKITAILREGKEGRWDATGPERYRLTFSIQRSALDQMAPLEVRFFWDEKLMASAAGGTSPR